MKTTKLRTKRVVLPAIAAATALAVGGPVWAATASDDDPTGSERERIGNAATKAVDGTVVDVETSDDGKEAYEVEVRADDGTETDVSLDQDLQVLGKDAEDRDEDDDDREGREDDRDEDSDGDDRAVSAKERSSAEKAAQKAVGSGKAVEVEASDDRGEAYEVEVREGDGTEWDVDLDDDYTVVNKSADR